MRASRTPEMHIYREKAMGERINNPTMHMQSTEASGGSSLVLPWAQPVSPQDCESSQVLLVRRILSQHHQKNDCFPNESSSTQQTHLNQTGNESFWRKVMWKSRNHVHVKSHLWRMESKYIWPSTSPVLSVHLISFRQNICSELVQTSCSYFLNYKI